MATVGERLRREREAHGATIEEVSAATGILRTYLEALEKDDFQSLPGRAFGKLYIRAYAETLGFDPRRLIDEYDRVQELEGPPPAAPLDRDTASPRRVQAVIERWRRSVRSERGHRADPDVPVLEPAGPAQASIDGPPILGGDQAVEPLEDEIGQAPSGDPPEIQPHEAAANAPDPMAEIDEWATGASVSTASEARPPAPLWTSRLALAAALAMGLCAVAAWVMIAFARMGDEPVPPASAVASPRPIPNADPPRVGAGREAAPPRPTAPAARTTPKVVLDSPGPSQLTVVDFGVGQRIAGHDLSNRVDRFDQWGVARFWTRVTGGEPGDLIHHVWLREGGVVQSIELEIGAADWRTHSRKTLGQPGDWAVEARDEDGRVLARATFTCVAPRR